MKDRQGADRRRETVLHIPPPQLQIDFSVALAEMRSLCLHEALSNSVEKLDVALIDRELAALVPKSGLAALAKRGLRGELVFPVPCILQLNPRLLGYYRLLLGFSQKSFYGSECGAGCFKMMEEKGLLAKSVAPRLNDLCKALIECALALVEGIGSDRLTRELLDDLTLLTLGPQFRGGANVKRGAEGIVAVFEIIHRIVKPAIEKSEPNLIQINNAAGRKVLIEFAADPDLIIREEMSTGNYRNIIAIEVKAGRDFSNIHNRIGEAEKSHQKARAAGYVECWTVVNVRGLDSEMARRESPSSNRFYSLAELLTRSGEAYTDFRQRIIGLTGIRNR